MGSLSAILEFAYADSINERKALLENPEFIARLGEDTVNEITKKQLLETDAINESSLLLEKVLETVYAGAEPFRCMRDVLPVAKTDKYVTRVVTSSAAGYAEEYAEGAEVADVTTDYDYTEIKSKLVMTGTKISNSLIEDSLFDIVELEIEKIGARLENKLNRDAVLAILSGADSGNDVDPNTATFTVSHVADAIGKVKQNNYFADKIVWHPYAEAQLWKDSNLVYVNRAGTDETLRSGKIGTLLGLEPYTTSVTTGDSTYYWDTTDGDNHFMAFVLDSKNAGLITMRRDISVKNADNILSDTVTVVGAMRYGVGVIRSDAIARIKTNTPS